MRQLSCSGCSSGQARISLQPVQQRDAPLNFLVAGGSSPRCHAGKAGLQRAGRTNWGCRSAMRRAHTGGTDRVAYSGHEAGTIPLQTASLSHPQRPHDGASHFSFFLQERRASNAQAGPTRVVRVQRPELIQEARTGLPVLGMEQEIMEAITGNDVCLLCGETGSGKTTQVSLSSTS